MFRLILQGCNRSSNTPSDRHFSDYRLTISSFLIQPQIFCGPLLKFRA